MEDHLDGGHRGAALLYDKVGNLLPHVRHGHELTSDVDSLLNALKEEETLTNIFTGNSPQEARVDGDTDVEVEVAATTAGQDGASSFPHPSTVTEKTLPMPCNEEQSLLAALTALDRILSSSSSSSSSSMSDTTIRAADLDLQPDRHLHIVLVLPHLHPNSSDWPSKIPAMCPSLLVSPYHSLERNKLSYREWKRAKRRKKDQLRLRSSVRYQDRVSRVLRPLKRLYTPLTQRPGISKGKISLSIVGDFVVDDTGSFCPALYDQHEFPSLLSLVLGDPQLNDHYVHGEAGNAGGCKHFNRALTLSNLQVVRQY